jgi:hypothetical protein
MVSPFRYFFRIPRRWLWSRFGKALPCRCQGGGMLLPVHIICGCYRQLDEDIFPFGVAHRMNIVYCSVKKQAPSQAELAF